MRQSIRDNLPTFLFLWQGLVYGLGFLIFFPYFPDLVGVSSLYTSMVDYSNATALLHPEIVTMVWGALAVISVVTLVISSIIKNNILEKFASGVGVSVWVFASLVYFSQGNMLIPLIVTLPALVFWAHYQIIKAEKESLIVSNRHDLGKNTVASNKAQDLPNLQ